MRLICRDKSLVTIAVLAVFCVPSLAAEPMVELLWPNGAPQAKGDRPGG